MLDQGPRSKGLQSDGYLKTTNFDPLQPRGNLGESLLPVDRPQAAMVFLPETRQIQHDKFELNRAIIVDVRLRPGHNYHMVQSVLMGACKSDLPFPLTHMSGDQYLLLLPLDTDRHRFLLQHSKQIHDYGYVTYPWSPGINAYPMRLKYKCWIELQRMSSQAWNLDHLIPAVSSFGVVLDHTPMTNLRSLEKMMVVVALTDLAKIPRCILLWVKVWRRTSRL